MNDLDSLSHLDLDRVCGGANTKSAKGNIGVDARGVKIGVQGEYSSSQSDYAACLKALSGAGASPKAIAATCGKPGRGE